MRDGTRLVNAARGELVDEEALVEALGSGKLAGAALDVFSSEPYSGPLLELDNVIVTPHLAASTEEAQDRAGVIVAEQVAAALEGGLVTNAVNIPAIRPEDLDVLGPYVPLAAKLGRLAMELAAGRAARIELSYYGTLAQYDTRLLTVAALNGAFQGRADVPVNYVNAPLIAAERGIEVNEERRRSSRDYTNLIRVRVRENGDEVTVAGTTIGRDNRFWLVNALGFELDIELSTADGLLPLRRRTGRDRTGGHALRPAEREHREHGRLSEPTRREGADGALARHDSAARARRGRSLGGLRRCTNHRPRLTIAAAAGSSRSSS